MTLGAAVSRPEHALFLSGPRCCIGAHSLATSARMTHGVASLECGGLTPLSLPRLNFSYVLRALGPPGLFLFSPPTGGRRMRE
jgi:hypothetical protein